MTPLRAGPVRLAYLVTHPIQYQAPLLRRIAAEPGIDLKVFFGTDFSARAFVAHEFNQPIEWDVPLLDGYAWEVLPQFRDSATRLDFWRPYNYGLAPRLRAGRFDALWVHGYARWLHWSGMETARRAGIKVMLRDEATAISTTRGKAKRAAKRVFFTGLDKLVDAYLAIGTLNRRYYEANGIAAAKVFDVPYAVDNAHFRAGAERARPQRDALRASLKLEPGRPIILFAAKLIERKRPADLLKAFASLAETEALGPPYLVFAGDGPLRAELEAMAQALAPRSVRFVGFINQRDLPRYYDLCDVFALPSEHEAWGLVVNEVMCAGKAVVVSDRVGSGPDLVHPGDNGAVFRMGEVDDLARALKDVLASPRHLAALGARSLEIIEGWDFEADIRGLRQALAAIVPGVAAAR